MGNADEEGGVKVSEVIALETTTTPRGFVRTQFTDLYGSECSLQESSLATDTAIWLGVHKAFEDSSQDAGPRMHLNREMVLSLLPFLWHFARFGGLPLVGEEPRQPRIVCLCGSTRFWKQFQEASLRETLAGKIVLSVGAAVASDEEHFGHLSEEEKARIKRDLDELHMRKIDLADEVYILNLDGYIGESTTRELAYARSLGKPVRFLEPVEDQID